VHLRQYDGTFTTNSVLHEETQKNDLDVVREVLKVTKEVPIEQAYDFSFTKKPEIILPTVSPNVVLRRRLMLSFGREAFSKFRGCSIVRPVRVT
jgi:hypothetical protein